MEIDVSLLFISCFSEYPVFSRITIQLKVLLSQQICGIIAAKQLLYPSYGQDDAQAEPAPVPMANYTISLRDYGIIAAKQLLYPSYGQDDAQAESAPAPTPVISERLQS